MVGANRPWFETLLQISFFHLNLADSKYLWLTGPLTKLIPHKAVTENSTRYFHPMLQLVYLTRPPIFELGG